MYVFWKIEPVGFADLLDMACERKRKEVKDNAKDFGLSLWGKWHCHLLNLAKNASGVNSGEMRSLVLEMLNLTCPLDIHGEMSSRQLNVKYWP